MDVHKGGAEVIGIERSFVLEGEGSDDGEVDCIFLVALPWGWGWDGRPHLFIIISKVDNNPVVF